MPPTDRELMQQALKAMGTVGADHICEASHHAKKDQHKLGEPCPIQQRWHIAYQALRERLAQPEPKADAHLFYAPGDVLICKESDERVVVKHGNTGPMQLANGKITLEWSDEVCGEYTLEQIMDGFIREGYAPRSKQPEQEPVAWLVQYSNKHEFVWGQKPQWIADAIGIEPLYTTPPRREWVGLTDEEMHECWGDPLTPLGMKCARTIEAKLREKNT